MDCVIADRFDNDAQRKVVPVNKIPTGWRGLDIGPETVKIINMEVRRAKTIVWNGPMGVFEMPNFANGTLEVARLLAEATKAGATTIVGGGDSAAAVAQAGFENADLARLDRRRRFAGIPGREDTCRVWRRSIPGELTVRLSGVLS